MIGHPLLVTRRDGALDLLREDATGAWTATPVAKQGRWPAWNPVRDIVAYSTLSTAAEPRSAIHVSTLAGEHLRMMFESQPGVPAVIAPRIPHYLNWSPGGDVLSFVAQGQWGLTFHMSDVDSVQQSDAVLNGAPIFHAWCVDNNFVAVHAGTELAVVESQGSRLTAGVATGAVGFRTPAYSDDHVALAYALPKEPGVGIWAAIFQGTQGREVARFPGGVALAFRPGTRELSVCVTHRPDTGSFDELWVLDLATDPCVPVKVANGPFVAISWSPTGESFALATPLQSGDGRYQFVVRDHAGGYIAASAPIVPSVDYRTSLGFFDQYVLSHHTWSPDGLTLVVCGRLPGDGVSSAFGESAGDYVYTWTPKPASPFELVTTGEFAVFPPRPRQLFN